MMKINKLFLPITILIAVLLRLVNLNQSLWLDEAAQALESIRPFSVQWQLDIDFHPPLFHYLLHFWQYLGTSEWLMRLLPVSFGVITVALAYLIGKKLLNEKFGLIFALFLATAPYHIYYSQELRNYSLITMLALSSYYLLISEKWKLYTLNLILALYANYFAAFIILSQGLYIFLFNKIIFKRFLISSIIALIFFIPWLYELKIQLENGSFLTTALPAWKGLSSLSPITQAIPQTFIKFALGRITFDNKLFYAGISILLFFVYSSIWIFGAIKNKNVGKLFLTYLLMPFLMALTVSFFIPINGPWRLLLIIPAFYGLLALGISNLSRKLETLIFLLVLLVNICGLLIYYVNPRFQRENWREAVSYIETNSEERTISLFEFPGVFAPFVWYSSGDKNSFGAFDEMSATVNGVNTKLSKVTFGKNKVFLFQYLQELTDPQKEAKKWLEKYGYRNSETKNFEGVGFVYTYIKM